MDEANLRVEHPHAHHQHHMQMQSPHHQGYDVGLDSHLPQIGLNYHTGTGAVFEKQRRLFTDDTSGDEV